MRRSRKPVWAFGPSGVRIPPSPSIDRVCPRERGIPGSQTDSVAAQPRPTQDSESLGYVHVLPASGSPSLVNEQPGRVWGASHSIPAWRTTGPQCRRAAVPPCRPAALPPCRRAAGARHERAVVVSTSRRARAVDIHDQPIRARASTRGPRPLKAHRRHPVQLADMPNVNAHRNVPTVVGADTPWPGTLRVWPDRRPQ